MGSGTFHLEPRSFLSILFPVYALESGRDNGVEADGSGSGRKRPRHTMRKDGETPRRESGDVTGAIEWKTEMLMRWSGRTSERPGESASDHSRKQEGGDSREERDKRAKCKLLVRNRDELKITTRLQER